jgi:uncharacterized protein YecE (DUF72 family)
MIRAGIGGWTYAPWRGGVFYPEGLSQAKELGYASRQLTAIEVNGTYYSTFKPPTFQKWRDETPDGFVFAVKASRFCTNRRVLAEGGEAVAKFCNQGLAELGDKLGPVLWQFMATKKFDPDDFGAFLTLLPRAVDGVALRHAVQVRNASFLTPEFVALCRRHEVAICYAHSDDYPAMADVSGPLVYARLESSRAEVETGYTAAELDHWAQVAKTWAAGGQPQGLPYAAPADPAPVQPRDVFVFIISGAKERAPAATQALIARV